MTFFLVAIFYQESRQAICIHMCSGWSKLNGIVMSSSDSCNAHLCNLTATNGGMPFLSLNIVVSGWWSVTSVSFRPYKYWWNFRNLKISDNASFLIENNFSHLQTRSWRCSRLVSGFFCGSWNSRQWWPFLAQTASLQFIKCLFLRLYWWQ